MAVLVPTTVLSRGLPALPEGCARRRRANQEGATQEDVQRPPGCPEAVASPPAELDTWAPYAHRASWTWRPRQGFPRVPHPQNIQGQPCLVLTVFQAFSCTADLSAYFWEVLGGGCPVIGNARQWHSVTPRLRAPHRLPKALGSSPIFASLGMPACSPKAHHPSSRVP